MSSEAGAIATVSAPAAESLELSDRSERIWASALACLPALITIYLGFESGGYYAGSVALATLVVTLVLIARILIAERPFAGVGRRFAVATGAFAAYTGWTLLSAVWSHAEARALTEFDRSLLYLLLLVLFGLLPRPAGMLRWAARSTTVGAFVVCGAGLITRVLPHVWPVQASFANERLSYPLTYWNALGILASIGVLLACGLASDPRELRVIRALAAASVPVFAATLLLTLSRGAIGALIVGVVVFVLITRTPSLLTAAIAIVPAAAVAAVVTYDASLLNGRHPRSTAAVSQGHHVALAVLLCALVAFGLSLALSPAERRLTAWFAARGLTADQRRAVLIGVSVIAAVVLAIAAATGLFSRIYNKFVQSGAVPTGNLAHNRLSSLSSDGRTPLWHAAWHAFTTSPFHGTGAGTYEFDWYRYRPANSLVVVDAHNLYLQVLAELGIVGLALLLVTLVTILVSLARGVPTEERVLYAGLLAAVIAWCLHAAVDWDWQMPAVTAWVFMVGGAALAARPVTAAAVRDREPLGRIPMALGLLVAAVTPGLLFLSQNHLQQAATAFQAGHCSAAEAQSLASINDLGVRPEPYQIVGYCDLHDGSVLNAVSAMRQAISREPDNWQYHYGLAIADGYAGLDPRSALRATLRLNASDPAIEPMLSALKTNSHDAWLTDARAAANEIILSGRLTLN